MRTILISISGNYRKNRRPKFLHVSHISLLTIIRDVRLRDVDRCNWHGQYLNGYSLPLPFAVKMVFLFAELDEDASANAVGDNIAEDGEMGLFDVFRSIDEPAREAGEHMFKVVVSG